MAHVFLICVLLVLVTNIVKATQLSMTSPRSTDGINALQENSTEKDGFALQIQENGTKTEAAPAISSGNNINVEAVPRHSQEVASENIQAISTNYTFHDEEKTIKIYNDYRVEPSLESNYIVPEAIKSDDFGKPLALIWENCLETIPYKSSFDDDKQKPSDMEYVSYEMPPKGLKVQEKYWSNGVTKRGINLSSNATAMQVWLQKYNNLKHAKIAESRQQNFNSTINAKTTENLFSTPFPIIPITTEFIKEILNSFNDTVNIEVTETNLKASYTEDWFEMKDQRRKIKLKFDGLPQRETYLVPSLGLEDGFYPFRFMSDFFTLIYPSDFPMGLIKDIAWGQFTFPYSFLQSIKVESTFLVFITIFTCMALIIPSYLIVIFILSLLSRDSGGDEIETGALFPDLEESDCNDRVLMMATIFMVLLCCAFVSGMVVSNEQAALATSESRDALSCACADIATWLGAAARELHHSLVPPVDLVLQAYRDDLRNVDSLLGDSIQKTLSSESGIDLVLDSLNDVISESEDLSGKISSLREISVKAGSLAAAASDRLKDLARQLDNVKKHCIGKDVPLCDTLTKQSLELKIKFDLILREQQLLELRSIGVENLTRAIGAAKQEFRTLPTAVATQTSSVRDNVLRDMEKRRETVYRSSKILTDIVRYLTAVLHSAARKIEAGLVRFRSYDFWQWMVLLCSTIIFGMVLSIILCAVICGCGNAKGHAKRTLKVSTVWMGFSSLILWSLISAIFLIAGHAEVYVCHALWDSPQYKILSNVLDRPSPLYSDNEGFFDALFREMENITIEVSVRDILRDCEKDRPAYNVFHLDKVLDVNKETSFFEWEDLQADLGKLTSVIDIGFLKTVSANLSRILNEMLIVSNVNFAKYRVEYNGPVVSKDLVSLADQLLNVAAQVTDLTTSGRLEALASRTQRLHLTNIKPLEQMRADVVFKLTELELQMLPFRRKLNISLSHLHTAQYYIDNQGDVIAQKKVSIYVSRLISHVAGWRTHVLAAVATQAARCKPLFTVYNAARTLLCSRYVASLHGWWVCGLFLGLSWCGLTPLCVKLWRSYGQKIRAHEAMNLTNLSSGQQGTPTTAMCDSNNWNTPGPPPPPRSDSW